MPAPAPTTAHPPRPPAHRGAPRNGAGSAVGTTAIGTAVGFAAVRAARQAARQAARRAVRDYELCEALFFTDDGRPWRLDDMPFFTTIYEDPAHHLVLKTSRQSTKTTLPPEQARPPHPSSAAGTPRSTWRRRRTRSATSARRSSTPSSPTTPRSRPRYAPACATGTSASSSSPSAAPSPRSRSAPPAAHQGAEGIRGGTYNDVFIDEYQSFLEEHVPVILECQATFDGRDGRPEAYHAFTGTPLSRNNPLEREWGRSRGYEWCIRCRHCSAWNEPLGLAHLDPARPYLFCQHCGKDVNRLPTGEAAPPEGEWVATNAKGRSPATASSAS